MVASKHWQNTTVHKFGGTSLNDAKRIEAILTLVTEPSGVIVVSALGGTTQTLQRVLECAVQQLDYAYLLDQIGQRHQSVIDTLFDPATAAELMAVVQNDLKHLDELLRSVSLTKSAVSPVVEMVLGAGEQWSARIVSAMFKAKQQTAHYLDATQVLITDGDVHNVGINWQQSQHNLDQWLDDKSEGIIVITGFIATDPKGCFTTLGRNGSDYSAAIFATLFLAKKLIIWTDVDGVLSANPNSVPNAVLIPALSYKEALELAYFGASVLHPKTIGPAMRANVPIHIKNSVRPDVEGTIIAEDNSVSNRPIKGLTSVDDVALLTIQGAGMIGVSGIAAKVFMAMDQANVSVIFISQASSEYSICFAVKSDQLTVAKAALKQTFELELMTGKIDRIKQQEHCSIIAAVGDGMVGKVGMMGELTQRLATAEINIRALAQGASERNISLVIAQADLQKALSAIHHYFFEVESQLRVVLIGPGLVGRTVLKQLKSAHAQSIKVIAIANSRHMLWHETGIDLDQWQTNLAKQGKVTDLLTLTQKLTAQFSENNVVIDCSGHASVVEHYLAFLKAGIYVVTPSKLANACSYDFYLALRSAQCRQHQFLYEATVAAGLPVIQTIQTMQANGDDIQTIEAVLSGSLSYIINRCVTGCPFSEAVAQAVDSGFTEPDPRIDLSGEDVLRKAVCLAREVGCQLEPDAVIQTPLVEKSMLAVEETQFLAQLPNYDATFKSKLQTLLKAHSKVCYAIKIDVKMKTVTMGLQGYDQLHSFMALSGQDNMIIIHSKYYQEHPLVISGPGAGAEVTAGGVMADVQKVASLVMAGKKVSVS